MRHVHLEPHDIVVLHKMTLQDLRNCELALMRALAEFNENAMQNEEIISRLAPSLERVADARARCQRDEVRKHVADDEEIVEIRA